MSNLVSIVFPHQLFRTHPALVPGGVVYLVEEWLFFHQYRFHQQKLLIHRATMRMYADYLTQQGYQVRYIPATDAECDIQQLIPKIASAGVRELYYADVVDDWLRQRLRGGAKQQGIIVKEFRSPNFFEDPEELTKWFDSRKHFKQTDFYINRRKHHEILLDKFDKPLGGKWTYDVDNRQKFPKGKSAPDFDLPVANEYVIEAQTYVRKHFGDNYGSVEQPFDRGFYPTTYSEADDWLADFLTVRFAEFGVYEDALVLAEPILHHSVLSPMLNTGLLSPKQVIDAALAMVGKVPLNSIEGFVRQIVGWREFMRITYERRGRFQRTRNYWGFTRKVPESFWQGTTGILPLDATIHKALKRGYCHHIERLMVVGNFMLLCEFDPDDVFRWFMEMFVDAYDWVMVPNVYAMSQFADGGGMCTKPYISGSNYLMKMSDYPKGDWQVTWDGLFWRFMHVHRDFFLSNPRLGMLVKTFDKMAPAKQQQHLLAAEKLLGSLDSVT
ncbi:cryptochrome/photolyase family protein [Chamaesiphon minutus]|uniref:Deoxyribodipyrimidine photolyase-related protein n=1 Tax=Chamaesiphon minutus (strain ATCC 27169 / PCC 6605) TaxID=1173020 RepID=K9ULZ8_CHAP6|nr:cryptochrome/photolyase family protein [Chamaesiphon minutus]AFY95219.1 deoxyribodipyrimidine photolyase-related protein [Chamaesiphon minutus PCC 6605]